MAELSASLSWSSSPGLAIGIDVVMAATYAADGSADTAMARPMSAATRPFKLSPSSRPCGGDIALALLPEACLGPRARLLAACSALERATRSSRLEPVEDGERHDDQSHRHRERLSHGTSRSMRDRTRAPLSLHVSGDWRPAPAAASRPPRASRRPASPTLRSLLDGLVALQVRVGDARQRNENGEQHQRQNHDSLHLVSPLSLTLEMADRPAGLLRIRAVRRTPVESSNP